MRMLNTLSSGERLRLTDMCVEVSERVPNPSESGLERFVGLEHMESGGTRLRAFGSTADLVSAMKLFQRGDILVARRNVYLRRAAVADFDGVCSGDAIVLRPRSDRRVIPELIPHLLNTDGFWEYAVKHAAGTMSKRLSVEKLLQYELRLPQIPQQQRMLAAVARLDECEESCRAVWSNGRGLLRSLLNRMWSSFPKRKIGDLVDAGLLAPPQDGNHGEKHPKASDYTLDGVPFVMASDLKDGTVDFENCSRIPEGKRDAEAVLTIRYRAAQRFFTGNPPGGFTSSTMVSFSTAWTMA